jgi:glycosyltransferase involved in cell wall biosynthesis
MATQTTIPVEKSLHRRKCGRVLVVFTVDFVGWVLLRPWLTALRDAGFEVHIACSRGAYFERLAGEGFIMHPVPFRRILAPWAHIRPLLELRKLIRQDGFDLINTHGPIASVVARLAARLGGGATVVCTVHGFYFHGNMSALFRWAAMAIEWLAGRLTDHFMFVSEEDHRTARRIGIARAGCQTTTIFNGVDLNVFSPKKASAADTVDLKRQLGIPDDVPVVGIVARIVREKGYQEFLEMARNISERRQAFYLVVGDSLPSDRDQFCNTLKDQVRKAGLAEQFVFTGQTDHVAAFLRVMDVFTLPSYREGFPLSIIEAMGTGLPVVATDIRGCREAVVHEQTGLIVPAKDAAALTAAVEHLLIHPDEAERMGRAGRARAVELYDIRTVQRRYVDFMAAAYGSRA